MGISNIMSAARPCASHTNQRHSRYLVVTGVEEIDSILLRLVVEVSVETGHHEVEQLLTRGFTIVHFKEDHLGKIRTTALPHKITFLPRSLNLSGNFLRRKGRSC